MRVQLTKISVLSSKNQCLIRNANKKLKNLKTGQTCPFFRFFEITSTLPCVVWAEESKTSLGFEIGPSYDDVQTTSQLVTDRQSSCIFFSTSGTQENKQVTSYITLGLPTRCMTSFFSFFSRSRRQKNSRSQNLI